MVWAHTLMREKGHKLDLGKAGQEHLKCLLVRCQLIQSQSIESEDELCEVRQLLGELECERLDHAHRIQPLGIRLTQEVSSGDHGGGGGSIFSSDW